MNNKNTIDLDQNLFAIGLQVVRRNWMPCTAAAMLLLAASIGQHTLGEHLPFTAFRALILMIIGYAACRVILSGGAVAGWRAVATDEGRVPWRYAGVMLMILTPLLLLGIVWTSPGATGGPSAMDEVALGMVMVIMYTVAYVLLGTALPEIAQRGETSLSVAIARGRSNYRRIATALMLGPWVFRAGIMALLILLGLAGFSVDLFHGATGAFQPEALPPTLLLIGGYVFAEVLTAVVLVRAYLRLRVMA